MKMTKRGFLKCGMAVLAALMMTPYVGAQQVESLQDPPGVLPRTVGPVCIVARCNGVITIGVGCSDSSFEDAVVNAKYNATQLLGCSPENVQFDTPNSPPCALNTLCPVEGGGSFAVTYGPCPQVTGPQENCWKAIVNGFDNCGRLVFVMSGYGKTPREARKMANASLCHYAQALGICIHHICCKSNEYVCSPGQVCQTSSTTSCHPCNHRSRRLLRRCR